MTRLLLIVALAIGPCCLAVPTGSKTKEATVVDYTNFKIVKIQPRSAEHVRRLKYLEKEFNMNYLTPAMDALRPVTAILSPLDESNFFFKLNNSKIGYEVMHSNVQEMIDQERVEMNQARLRGRSTIGDDFDYQHSYHTYEEIWKQFKFLAQKYQSTAKYMSVGTSYEGRDIPALAIGSGPAVVILECGIHAREWISSAFGTWLAHHLLLDKSNEALLKKFQFIVVPSLNVDGFVYTHTTDRIWRKSRSPQNGTDSHGKQCFGVDLNRNFDTKFFGEIGVELNPCSEIYPGKKFSDVESRSMAQLVLQYKGKISAYFSIHSFKQLFMYPYAYTTELAPNAEQLSVLSQKAVQAIAQVNGLQFTAGPIATTIYETSGDSIDWAYDTAGVKNAFALELRDRGEYGFELPANQIQPAVLETWAGIKAVVDQL